MKTHQKIDLLTDSLFFFLWMKAQQIPNILWQDLFTLEEIAWVVLENNE